MDTNGTHPSDTANLAEGGVGGLVRMRDRSFAGHETQCATSRTNPREGCLDQDWPSPKARQGKARQGKARQPESELLRWVDLNKFGAAYVHFCPIEGSLSVDQGKAGRVLAEIWVSFRCGRGDFSTADTDPKLEPVTSRAYESHTATTTLDCA